MYLVNKEDESVLEGGVITLQTSCVKAGQRSVSKGREDFICLDENSEKRVDRLRTVFFLLCYH